MTSLQCNSLGCPDCIHYKQWVEIHKSDLKPNHASDCVQPRKPHVCDCEFCGHPDTLTIPAKPPYASDNHSVIGGCECKNEQEVSGMSKLQGAYTCKPPDPVEEKIKKVSSWLFLNAHKMKCPLQLIESELRELVEMVRKECE